MAPEGPARFEVRDREGGKVVCLYGAWDLFAQGRRRQRIAGQLKRLEDPGRFTWDLTEVEAMDSAGALMLWHLWGGRMPDTVRCRSEQRQWFERLGRLEIERPSAAPWTVWIGLRALGMRLEVWVRNAWEMSVLVGQVIVDIIYLLRHPGNIPWVEISASVYRTGVAGLVLLGVIGALIGIVMTYQLAMTLERFGANSMIVGMLGLSVLRELGPVITALIVIGRNGSATTASIGAMRITEELSALRVFGMSPTLRLVTPRVIGMSLSVPLLTVWTDFTALAGGMFAADMKLGVPYNVFIQRFPHAVQWVNLWIGLGKGLFFGFVIAVVSCYFGMKIRANTQSLSTETTNSVVTSLAFILLTDATLGALLTNVGLVPQ